jgi:hypothetical protein
MVLLLCVWKFRELIFVVFPFDDVVGDAADAALDRGDDDVCALPVPHDVLNDYTWVPHRHNRVFGRYHH